MKIFELIGMVVPENVFFHHTGLGYARADNGGGRYESLIIITLETAQQATHGRTFDIKASNCFSMAQKVIGLRLIF